MAFLNDTGLTHLWSIIKSALGNKVDKVSGKGLSTNDYTTAEKNKLAGIAAGANVNQNAFSNVTVGSTTVAADSTTDTLTLVAGSNVSITPDATNDKITISATVPTKVSQLTNDSGYKTTDNNTTYSISKSGSTITLTGSDGSTSTVSDANTTYGVATTSAAGLMSVDDKKKLNGVASGAEVNQNAFSNVVVGSTTVAADSKTDTLTLVAGSNVTLTPDATNDKITIASKDTVYTHPSYSAKSAGLYKVTVDGTGHVSAATAVTKSDITALGIPAQDTTYNTATTSANGLMSSGDKSKLDGIATGATKVVVDSSLSTSSANPVQNKLVTTEINSLKTLVGDTAVSTQISNYAAPKSHTHSYAGSSSAGGSATSAVKLDTATAGSTTQPVYFTGGKPSAISYTIAKSVPSNAVFTDVNVTQTAVTASEYTNWRSLVFGQGNNVSEGFSPANATGVVYSTSTLSCQPSTGSIRANVYKFGSNAKIEYDSTNECLNFVFA